MYGVQALLKDLRPIQKTAYFDHFKLRLPNSLKELDFTRLQNESRFIDKRRGNFTTGCSDDVLLTVVGAQPTALEILSDVPHVLGITYLELALDISFADSEPLLPLYELFQKHFVQRWIKSRETIEYGAGTYTGPRRPGLGFVHYPDKPDRNNGYEHCFHIEARYLGTRAVRRAGINSVRDLVLFDHRSFWYSNLQLYEVNLERLGRFHINQISGRKRQSPLIRNCRSFTYNIDRATGCVLFRTHGLNPRLNSFAAQSLVRNYGRGPFLERIDASNLLP